MKFSFIICTMNRTKELDECISSIYEQSYDNYEIIVIDQSDVINNMIKKKFNNIKYIHSTKKGLSYNRNLALEYVTGDYCILMDDDAKYKKDNLKIANKILCDNDYDVLSGIIIDPISHMKFDKKYPDIEKEINGFGLLHLPSAGLYIKRNILFEYRFDEMFGVGSTYGCGEETDLLLRMKYDKKKVYYTPNIVIYHPVTDKGDIDLKKLANYNFGFGALYAKHIKTYNSTLSRTYYYIAIVKNIIGVILGIVNKNKKNYHKICLENKIKGYKSYKVM